MAGRKFGSPDNTDQPPDLTDSGTFLSATGAHLKHANGYNELAEYGRLNSPDDRTRIAWLEGHAQRHWGEVEKLIDAAREAESAAERPRVVASASPRREATGS